MTYSDVSMEFHQIFSREIPSGISTEIRQAISSEITSGIYLENQPVISTKISPGIPFHIRFKSASKMTKATLQKIPQGFFRNCSSGFFRELPYFFKNS